MQYENAIVNEDCMTFLDKIEAETVTMALYDPPYYTSSTRTFDFKKNGKKTRKSYTTNLGKWDWYESEEAYFQWLRDLLIKTRRVLIPHGSLYMFCRDGYISDIRRILGECGFYFKKVIVWVKRNPFQNVQHVNYSTSCEFQVFAKKSEKEVVKDGDKSIKKTPAVFNWLDQEKIFFPRDKFPNEDPWEMQMHNHIETPICMAPERLVGENGEVLHKTQKPIEVLIRPILVSSSPGDIVLDVTCGCGSTLEAAKILERKYVGCEANERYYKFAKARLNGELPNYRLSRRVDFLINKITEKKKTVSIDSFFVE